MKNFVTGGNREDLHLKNVNLGRDFELEHFADLRVITPHDPCPRCNGEVRFGRGIEVGHIFMLGTKYSHALKAVFLEEHGKESPIVMGCYGIGVGRTVAAAIEQNHDKLLDYNIDALLDDRDERAGVKFNDADLLGTPVRVTVGLRGVKSGHVEIKLRAESESTDVQIKDAPAIIREKVKELYDSLK
jgi:prolyl-tRNA synthetase